MLLAHLALVYRLTLIVEVSTAETVGTRTIDLQRLYLFFVRHRPEFRADV